VTDSFHRYLRAKRTVDDRAIERRLVGDLREALADRAAATDGPLRVLEIGAGIGTMVSRAVKWDLLPPGDVAYTAVDVRRETVESIPEYLREWAGEHPVSVSGTDPLVLDAPDRTLTVEPVVADAVAYADGAASNYDLLVGAALLDLLDLDALETLLGALAESGLFYFPITFDGATRFLPGHPSDRAVERRYHKHMDRKPGGSSRAGGELLARLQQLAAVGVLGVAGSDWVVRPVDGTYPDDEAYFLRYVLDTVETALGELDGEGVPDLDEWLDCRRDQVAAGELVYLTHQLDVLGRVGGH